MQLQIDWYLVTNLKEVRLYHKGHDTFTCERFETARAFYVALHQRRRRPGKTYAGFEKALAKVPLPVLRAVASGVRRRIAQVFAVRLWVTLL